MCCIHTVIKRRSAWMWPTLSVVHTCAPPLQVVVCCVLTQMNYLNKVRLNLLG